MLCRSQWLHDATGCARAIISLRDPISSFRQRVHSRRGRAGSSHATHWQRQCSQLHTRWPTTSTRQRSTPGGALTLDGGSAWAWGRSGWIHAYRGKSVDAIERFQIARNLAPSDPLIFLAAVGIAAAHFEAYRYDEAVHWYRRALVEQPKAVWINRFLTAGFALAGRKDEAKRSLCTLISAFPSLTISQIRTGLPHSVSFRDSVSNGLESVGMRIC
jgi:tetratricopeptide (TPR) repeat protein